MGQLLIMHDGLHSVKTDWKEVSRLLEEATPLCLGLVYTLTWIFKPTVSRSCIKPLGVLNLLRGVWWGADPSIFLAIYKALIRSRLEYGAFIWNELPAYLGKKVDRIQYKAVRLALGYRRSCPINVILGESKELPLELRLEFLGRNFLAKVFGNYDHPLLPVLTSYADLTETPTFIPKRPPPLLVLLHKDIVPISYLIVSDNKPCYSSFKFETLLVEPDVSFSEGEDIKNCIHPSHKFEAVFNDDIYSTYSVSRYFTDGSKYAAEPFVGYGIVALTNNECKTYRRRSSNHTSIFILEGMAIAFALKLALCDPNRLYCYFQTRLTSWSR
ncbi:hypothetical protein DMN91_012073 [Ooceraea biroi]|uniref:RNase H type-1 domain-containing protein n=1 Tax=Ooceraea biroi TaxID=2015173 RepID=A0A3L8D8A2_OOCBI|nr:hypothetical protein DMN91_012073 [Ooceraea biroi]